MINPKPKIKYATTGKSFVGLQYDKKLQQLVFSFPMGYTKIDEDDATFENRDIQNLINLICKSKKKGFLPINESDEDIFPIYEYLYVINYFISHNYSFYQEREVSYSSNSSGKISWSKTFKFQKPYVIDGKLVYVETIKRHLSPNENNLITIINKYCVHQSLELFSSIFGNLRVDDPIEIYQYDSDYLISFLYSKIDRTNNDNNKELFNAMIKILSANDSVYSKNDSDSDLSFGTTSFEDIWEDMVDEVFGTLHGEKKDLFNPKAIWSYIDDAGHMTPGKETHKMRPDTILDKNNKIYIIDAKNYPFGINLDNPNQDLLPSSTALFKQYFYLSYAENLTSQEDWKDLTINKNSAFIIPYNKADHNGNTIEMRAVTNQDDNYLYAVLFDTKDLVDFYIHGSPSSKNFYISDLIEIIDDNRNV